MGQLKRISRHHSHIILHNIPPSRLIFDYLVLGLNQAQVEPTSRCRLHTRRGLQQEE